MKNLVVAGGGVLGSQIGLQSAYKGKHVTFWLRSEESIERSKQKLEKFFQAYLADLEGAKKEIGKEHPNYARGLIDDFSTITEEKIDQLISTLKDAYNNISFETDLAKAVTDADFLIEAVAEVADVKHEFFKTLSTLLPEKTIVASNSSTMLPSTFAKDTKREEKYLHFHFANNIWRMNVGEIMVHPNTAPETKDAVVKFAKEIGMVPVVINKEQPGYILNSLLVPLLNSAQDLFVGEIADFKDIDKTWKISTGAPLGPFEILDVVGIYTPYNLAKAKPGADDPSSLAGKAVAMYEKMIQEGRLGKASGKGFYTYDERGNIIA